MNAGMFQVCQGTCLCAPSPEGYGKGKVLYCYGEVRKDNKNMLLIMKNVFFGMFIWAEISSEGKLNVKLGAVSTTQEKCNL